MAASIRPPVVVILGATGTGKTKLSLELARLFNGEIISADSMQIYKGLDIITNKATAEEQKTCPHHMIDYLPPHKTNTVQMYKAEAVPIIDSILEKKKVPIIVGGTVFYIAALLWNSTVIDKQDVKLARSLGERTAKVPRLEKDDTKPEEPATACTEAEIQGQRSDPDDSPDSERDDREVGEEHEIRMDYEDGVEIPTYKGIPSTELHKRLQEVDSVTADKLHPQNRRKIIRALVVYERYGVAMSEVYRAQQQGSAEDHAQAGSPRYPHTCVFWLQSDTKVLHERLDTRVDKMIEQGLVQELTDFHAEYNKQRLAENKEADYTTGIFQSIGFKEFHDYLMLSDEERKTEKGQELFHKGVSDLKLVTRRYARYQIRRFKRLFFGAAVAVTSRLPVYKLDCTDVSRWDEMVGKPAVDILTAFTKGEPSPVAPMEPEKEAIRFERHECKVCDVITVTEHETRNHMKSKAHKAKTKIRHNEYRKLSTTLETHIKQNTAADDDGSQVQT